jgi:cobalt-zinc-cadmium resistance protein CzcA
MLGAIVTWSIRMRFFVVAMLALLLAGGGVAARYLPIDALPDVSTVQVSVLTDCPGLSPVEVERTVTFPMEASLNGLPKLVEMRSVSRSGLSAVTVIFEDGTDIWFARQMVLERVRAVEASLPKVAGKPELSPVSGGLGEIYQFVVRSDKHSPTQLRTILDWEIVPKLRSVPGVIEVNTMGGDLKEYHVVIDRGRLHAHEMTLKERWRAPTWRSVAATSIAAPSRSSWSASASSRTRRRSPTSCSAPPRTAHRCSCATSRR